jgi:AcrR family transcriptional regulator
MWAIMARPRTISDKQILDTARSCFLEHGPNVPTETIAGELGVSPQALLKRFHSKNELLMQSVLPCSQAPWIPMVEAGPDKRPLEAQLSEILLQLAEFFVDISRRMSVLRWSGVDPKDLMSHFDEPPPITDIRVLSGWLERAAKRQLIRKVDFKATAMMMLTSMHGPAMLTDMLGKHPTGHSRKRYVSFMVDMLMQGMVPRENSVLEQR